MGIFQRCWRQMTPTTAASGPLHVPQPLGLKLTQKLDLIQAQPREPRAARTPSRQRCSQLAIQAPSLKSSSARSSTSSSPVKLKRLHASMPAVELYVPPLLRQCKFPPLPHLPEALSVVAAQQDHFEPEALGRMGEKVKVVPTM